MTRQAQVLPLVASLACILGTLIVSYWSLLLVYSVGVVERNDALQVLAVENDEALLSDLASVAEQHDGRIAVVIPQPAHLEIFAAGDVTARTYRGPFLGVPVELKELSDVPVGDARHMYQLGGSKGFRQEVISILDQHGVQWQELQSEMFMFLFGGTPLMQLFILALLLTSAAALVSTLLRSRDFSIWQLHGYGFFAIFAKELARSYLRILAAGVAFLACVTAGLAGAISGHLASTFWHFLMLSGAALLTTMLLTILIALFIVTRLPITARLKGKLPTLATTGISAALQASALVVVATFAVPAFAHLPEWQIQKGEASAWTDKDDIYVAELSGARELEGLAQSTSLLATQVREQSARGQAIFAEFQPEGVALSAGIPNAFLGLNETAAQLSLDQPLPADPTMAVMYVPLSGVSDQSRSILEQRCSENCRIEYVETTGSAFTWQHGPDAWMERSFAQDPVLTIYPNDSLPSDRTIAAAVSRGEVGFLNPTFFEQLANTPDLANFVRGIGTFSSQWGAHHQKMATALMIYMGGFLASFILAVLVAFSSGAMYRRVWHQRIWVSFAFGLPLRWLYRRIGVLILIACLPLLWHLWQRSEFMREIELAPPGAFTPSMIAMMNISPIALAACALTVLVCAAATLFTCMYRPLQLRHPEEK